MPKLALQKIIADRGYCSRRQAEELIAQGRVELNHQIAELGARADEKDLIKIGRHTLTVSPEKIYLIINKPAGYTCTNRYFKNEKNIFSLLPFQDRLFAVGRLDKDSRGLIIITNDGDLTQRLSHPRFKQKKVYRVSLASPKAETKWEEKKIKLIEQSLSSGVRVPEEDRPMKATKIQYLQNGNFIITLSEGRNRQIRKMFASLGYMVKDLIRIEEAGLSLGSLAEGKWRHLTEKELKDIRQ